MIGTSIVDSNHAAIEARDLTKIYRTYRKESGLQGRY